MENMQEILFMFETSKKEFFLRELQNICKQFLFDSIYINNPKKLFLYLNEELKNFLLFYQTENIEIPYSQGKLAISKGLNKNIIYSFFDSIQCYIFNYIDLDRDNIKTVVKLSNKYIKQFLHAFQEEKELRKDLKQAQLYRNVNNIIQKQEKEQKEQITAFLINMAHETKLPLTIIENQIDMIKEETKDITIDNLSPLDAQVKELKETMCNILDIEKIRRGEMLYNHKTIVNISNIITSKLELFKSIFIKKHISVESNIQPNLYTKIHSRGFDRIINNLIDNATKYNREGGSINLTLKSEKSLIILIIEDTGYGIPFNQLKHIFKPYYQCTQKKRSSQGIGIGLSLLQGILAEVSGSINVESKVNKGTTVTITFIKRRKQKRSKNVIENFKGSLPIYEERKILKKETFLARKKTILFIEDDIELLACLQENMMYDFNFYYARNGIDALQKLDVIQKPDIIISDIIMDVMDGYELFKKVKEKPEFQDVPFIFLTAKNTEKDQVEGLKLGALDYIVKPFSINTFKQKLKSIIYIWDLCRDAEFRRINKRLIEFIKIRDTVKKEDLYVKFGISKREKEVLFYVCQGWDIKQIAEKLFISYYTAKTHIYNLKIKCNVNNRFQLMKLFQ